MENVHPLFLGVSFLYIVHFLASQPSICTFQGNSLDAYPIKILLYVVKRAMSLWNYCSGVIFSLMQLVRLVQSIECGGGSCLLQETSFLHPCTFCTFPLPSIPLSLGFLGVPVALWLFNSPRVGIALGVCLPFLASIRQSYPRIGLLGPRPSHNIYIYIYIYG